MPAETHVTGGVPDADEVLSLIRERIADILEIDAASVTIDSRFDADLDADPLALIELVEQLEQEIGERSVGFTVDDEDLADLATVRDAVRYIVGRLSVPGDDT